MYCKPCHPMMKTLEVDVFLCYEGMNQHPAPLASYCSRISKTAPAVHSSCGTLGVAKQPEECTQFWNPLIRFEVQTSVKHPFEKRMAPLLPMQQPKCRHLCMLVAWQAGGPCNAQMELYFVIKFVFHPCIFTHFISLYDQTNSKVPHLFSLPVLLSPPAGGCAQACIHSPPQSDCNMLHQTVSYGEVEQTGKILSLEKGKKDKSIKQEKQKSVHNM